MPVSAHTLPDTLQPMMALESTGMIQTIVSEELSTSSIFMSKVMYYAQRYNINEDQYYQVILCESKASSTVQSFSTNPRTGRREDSWGYAQIHLPDHPDVTKEQAINPDFALDWMAYQWSLGNQKMWTCYRNIFLPAGG